MELTASGSIRLARLTSHHFALLLLLLSAGKEKVGRGEVDVGVLGDRFLAQSHAANRRHVSFRAEHKERDAESASDFAHTTETLLVVGSGATHEDGNVVFHQACLILAQRSDDALKDNED